MAEFPRYQSKGQLTTQAPSVAAVGDTSGQALQKIGEVGNAVQNASLKWANAVDTIQKTTASANFKSGLLDIENRAQNDPEYNNSDTYFKEIEKLKTDSLKGFSSKAAESETAINFGYEAKVTGIKIQNLYKKKMIDVGQASTLQLINTEVNNPTDSSFQSIKNLLNNQVNSGLIGREDAYRLLEKSNKELGINRVYNDLNQANTPEEADAIVKKIQDGYYKKGGITIDPKEESTMIKSAETISRQIASKNNHAAYIERQSLVHDLTDQANNGILKANTLEEAFLQKGISNSTYQSLKDNVIGKSGPTAGTDPQTYYDLTHYLLSGKTTTEEAIKKILDANSQGKLSRNDQKKLYEMHLMPSSAGEISLKEAIQAKPQDSFDKMKSEYDKRTELINEKRKWFSPAFKSFNEYFGGPNKIQDVTEATQELVENIQKNNIPNNQIPTEADRIIGQQNLKKYPDWAKYPKEGMTMYLRQGGAPVTVYPDGRIVRKKK